MVGKLLGALAFAGAAMAASGALAQPLKLAGTACESPPVAHCPDKDCPGATVTMNGQATEPKTGRPYFLDYPCDLKKDEKVTLILSLHGGESFANWQRHYFPALDVKDKRRLVIANATSRPAKPRWDASDDAYLHNIVTQLVSEIGAKNIKAFWLAGHSNGGLASRRIVCSDFFKARVDGFVSLSGGRIGGAAPNAPGAGRPPQAGAAPVQPPAGPPPAGARPTAPPGAGVDPACDFSHIYTTGQHEVTLVPATSTHAQRLGCAARVKRPEVADTKGGYVHDGTHQNPASPQWGRLPRGGQAEVFVYPNCQGGRLVADVVRLDKGHTEGLEPNVTDAIVGLMLEAGGGKIAKAGS